MKAFTIILGLAIASSANAIAVDGRVLEQGFTERACGTTGAPCTSGDDCCTYCDPYSGWTCTDVTSSCVEKGTFSPYGAGSCCSKKADSNGNCL